MSESSHSERDSGAAGAAEPATTQPAAAPRLAETPALVPTWVALVVLGVLLALAALGGYGVHELLDGGNAAERRQLAAIESWRTKVAESPQDVQSRLKLANALVDAGQYRSAVVEYDTVLKENPNDVAALYGRASVLSSMGDVRDAESAYWAVLQQEPGHVRAAEALGDYYASKAQYRSLIVAVKPAVAVHPTEARLQYLLGLAYENTGHRDWAIERYRLALKAVPDMPEATAALACLGANK